MKKGTPLSAPPFQPRNSIVACLRGKASPFHSLPDSDRPVFPPSACEEFQRLPLKVAYRESLSSSLRLIEMIVSFTSRFVEQGSSPCEGAVEDCGLSRARGNPQRVTHRRAVSEADVCPRSGHGSQWFVSGERRGKLNAVRHAGVDKCSAEEDRLTVRNSHHFPFALLYSHSMVAGGFELMS